MIACGLVLLRLGHFLLNRLNLAREITSMNDKYLITDCNTAYLIRSRRHLDKMSMYVIILEEVGRLGELRLFCSGSKPVVPARSAEVHPALYLMKHNQMSKVW